MIQMNNSTRCHVYNNYDLSYIHLVVSFLTTSLNNLFVRHNWIALNALELYFFYFASVMLIGLLESLFDVFVLHIRPI